MRNKSEIYMDFKRAKKAASQLDAVAESLSKSSNNKMAGCISDLSGAWVCSASTAFRSKEEQLQSSVNQTASELRTIADTIRRDAKRMYEAELRAIEIAAGGSSGGGSGGGGGSSW